MSSLATSKFLCGFVGVEGGGGLFVEIILSTVFFILKGLTLSLSTAETRQPVNCKQSSLLIDIFLGKTVTFNLATLFLRGLIK